MTTAIADTRAFVFDYLDQVVRKHELQMFIAAVAASTPTSTEALATALTSTTPPSPPPNEPRTAKRFKATCTHLTVTRCFGPELVCDICQQTGSMGWIYCCSQDQEDLIEDMVHKGDRAAVDTVGEMLTSAFTKRKNSARARKDRHSIFGELSADQLASYTPSELITLVVQRQNLREVIKKDVMLRDSARQATLQQGQQEEQRKQHWPLNAPADNPWALPPGVQKCQYKVCAKCRPNCKDRSFLSLNAIANGEIVPTAAVGYGFHPAGARPVHSAHVVRNLGLRRYPRVEPLPGHGDDTSSIESWSPLPPPSRPLAEPDTGFRDLLLGELAYKGLDEWSGPSAQSDQDENRDVSFETLTLDAEPGLSSTPKHFKAIGNIGKRLAAAMPRSLDRDPWTPPPTPMATQGKMINEKHAASNPLGMGNQGSRYNPEPLNQRRLVSAEPSDSASRRLECLSLPHDRRLGQGDGGGAGRGAFDVPIRARGDDTVKLASRVPLPKPSLDEEFFLAVEPTEMMEWEEEEGRFCPAPLQVDHGVALMEESVALGLPDITTQA